MRKTIYLRVLLLVVSTSFAIAAGACSCVDAFVPLDVRICSAAAAGGLVLEVVLTDRQDTDSSVVRIDRQLVGTTDIQSLTLLNGNGSMCGFSIHGAERGTRYLLFAGPDELADGRLNLFTCGSTSTMYQMNASGTEIAYGVAPSVGERMRYEDFDRAALGGSCTIDAGELAYYRQFGNLRLFDNPGNGRLRIDVTGGNFPDLTRLRAYSILGQHLLTVDLTGYEPGTELNLTRLPRGITLLEVSDGVLRRTFRYLRAN